MHTNPHPESSNNLSSLQNSEELKKKSKELFNQADELVKKSFLTPSEIKLLFGDISEPNKFIDFLASENQIDIENHLDRIYFYLQIASKRGQLEFSSQIATEDSCNFSDNSVNSSFPSNFVEFYRKHFGYKL